MSALPDLSYDIWVVQKGISYCYIPVVVVVIDGVGFDGVRLWKIKLCVRKETFTGERCVLKVFTYFT